MEEKPGGRKGGGKDLTNGSSISRKIIPRGQK